MFSRHDQPSSLEGLLNKQPFTCTDWASIAPNENNWPYPSSILEQHIFTMTVTRSQTGKTPRYVLRTYFDALLSKKKKKGQ